MQSAPKGSYRVEQLLEFFDQLLPVASRPEDACCLYVDWFSAHLSDEVWELVVETKGHMLAYHGGGVTGILQANDTHIHEPLSKHFKKLEMEDVTRQRRLDRRKIPRRTRLAAYVGSRGLAGVTAAGSSWPGYVGRQSEQATSEKPERTHPYDRFGAYVRTYVTPTCVRGSPTHTHSTIHQRPNQDARPLQLIAPPCSSPGIPQTNTGSACREPKLESFQEVLSAQVSGAIADTPDALASDWRYRGWSGDSVDG